MTAMFLPGSALYCEKGSPSKGVGPVGCTVSLTGLLSRPITEPILAVLFRRLMLLMRREGALSAIMKDPVESTCGQTKCEEIKVKGVLLQ